MLSLFDLYRSFLAFSSCEQELIPQCATCMHAYFHLAATAGMQSHESTGLKSEEMAMNYEKSRGQSNSKFCEE